MPVRMRSASSFSSLIRVISSPKRKIRPESGRRSPFASFSNTLLPTPAGPRRIRVSRGPSRKLTSSSTGGPLKAIETCSKTTGSTAGSAGGASGTGWLIVSIRIWQPYTGGKSQSITRLSRKSVKMIITEETTTACVVARPTPWVPPVVFMPKKQPTVEMMKPKNSGFVSP